MAGLIAAVGFCVFDGHDHDGTDDHAALDLCLGLMAVSLLVALADGLPVAGRTVGYRPERVREFSPHVPAPPPKLLA
jgi:hypothetical protein